MDALLVTYTMYLLLSVGLTVWVATTLSRHGKVFLADVFGRDERLAGAVNQLLVVGFYLVNLGFVALWLGTDDVITSASAAVETLALKLGTVLLVLGLVHLLNVWVFNRVRRHRMDETRLRGAPEIR